MSFAVDCDLSGFEAGLDQIVQKAEKAVRPAAQAGAQVLYDAVRANVATIGRKTGKLANAIYQAYSPEASGPGVAEYHVSWNAKKAPHAHLVEYGYLQRYESYFDERRGRWVTRKDRPLAQPRVVGARPFMRPAAAQLPAAEAAIEREFEQRLGQV